MSRPPLPHFPGWELVGSYPEGDPDGVGSWVLHHDGEALLLECPPGLRVKDVRGALARVGAPALRYMACSHAHEDHWDRPAWRALRLAFPDARAFTPGRLHEDRLLDLDGEPLWLLAAPKHSPSDLVTVFRGCAMTGDIELGTLDSVNREVPAAVKRRSMRRFRDFEARAGYHVHTTVSAHLNDVRQGVCWPDLFAV
jgi:glyoxylase-like metal-dependent hydrolase (beta-lactamase superfamily II)